MTSLPDASPSASTGNSGNQGALYQNGSRVNTFHQAASKPAAPSAPSTALQPTKILQNFGGTLASQSSCGCQPPDSNGAVNSKNIVEATNLAFTVWTKAATPTLVKRVSFNTFLGTSDSLSDPRVLYDDAWNRWVITIIPIPASSSSTPAEWFAVSQTSSATGKWWIYRIGFGGGPYQPGVLLDYPMMGMTSDAVVISNNNFQHFPSDSYVGSAVWAVPKQRAYNGQGFGFSAFGVNWSSHPAFVEGIPQNTDGRDYIVGSQVATGNGTGFDVYHMLNAASPDSTTVTFDGSVADTLASFAKPSCAPQPGGGNCLDALDGRLQAAPHQLNGKVWFAHAVGFPLIEYGFINTSTLTATTSSAFVSASSNDWNPSIGVADAGSGTQYVFLNWAYDDLNTGTQVSTRVAGLGPADAVQSLVGVGTTLATGGHGNDFRFGDYSSVAIDPSGTSSCAAGKSAFIANEEFDSTGQWQMRDARIGFC